MIELLVCWCVSSCESLIFDALAWGFDNFNQKGGLEGVGVVSQVAVLNSSDGDKNNDGCGGAPLLE